MPVPATKTSPTTYARIAGMLYLIIIVSGITSEVFIRASLIVSGDAATTAGNILASPSFFRLGFVLDSIMLIADIAIAVVFYVLLKPVSNILSLTAAAFRLMQAAVIAAGLLSYTAALLLLTNTGTTAALESNALHSLSMLFIDIHSHGYDLGLIFFGVSSLVLGYLVIQSRYFPAILGYGLMGAALVYLLGSYMRFLSPEYVSTIQPLYIIPLVAELSFCLWLLVKGVRVQEG